jgi:preprotein translocase subunit SecD
MNGDLEPRLQDALHGGTLPPAPASLLDALERVPDAPVGARTRRGGRAVLGLLAAAAILVVASAVTLTGGATPRPGPSVQTPAPSLAAGVPGLRLEYTAQPVDGVAPTPADMAKIASILRARIDAMGVADPSVTTHDTVIVVELPGVTDPVDVETAGRMLGQTGKVELVPLGENQATVGQRIDPTTFPPLFGGEQIASASGAADQNGSPAVDLMLKSEGARLFGDYTANHIGSYFAITVDGVVLSAPVIQNAIPNGNVEITGPGVNGFDATEANHLVALIGPGALPFPIAVTSSAVIGVPSAEPSVAGSSSVPSVAVSSPRPSRLHIELAPVVPGPGDADLMTKAVDILQTRIANAGFVSATAEAQGTDRITVEFPGVTSTGDSLATFLVSTGRVNLIDFREGQVAFPDPLDPAVNPMVLAEDAVDSVTVGVDQAGTATFDLTLTQDAAAAFTGYAAAHAGSKYAIVTDTYLLIAPVTLHDFSDGVLAMTAEGIVVDPSDAGVRAILAVLRAGPLPLDMKTVSSGIILEPQPSAP